MSACIALRDDYDILHRMWRDGTDFQWSSKEVAA